MIENLYVENGVGRAVHQAINLFTAVHRVTAVFQHDVHPQMQRKQYGDEWWIADIAQRDMAILTQDRAILEDPVERQAIIDNNAKVVALGDAEYTTWNKLRCVVAHWEKLERIFVSTGPQAVTLFLSDARFESFS